MSESPVDVSFRRWRGALLDVVQSPESIVAWQDRRYRFAYEVGRLLVEPSALGRPPVTGAALYGVYVPGNRPLYIGQTGEAERRLRDLPVGESHHLAATFPPEIWDRVVVIQWETLVPAISRREARIVDDLGPMVCGQALEHLLQLAYRPIMAERRRGRTGTWTERNLESSRSVGAIKSQEIPELASIVKHAWEVLASQQHATGQAARYADSGRTVFPGAVVMPVEDHDLAQDSYGSSSSA